MVLSSFDHLPIIFRRWRSAKEHIGSTGGGHLVAIWFHHHRIVHGQPRRFPHRFATRTANQVVVYHLCTITHFSSLDDLAKQYKIEYAPVKGSSAETYFRRMAEIEEQFYKYG